jgi:hypothetical protein
MPGRIAVVVIHGMGAQEDDFANALMADVLSRMDAPSASRIVWKPIYWARVLEPRETALWTAMTSARDPAGKSVPLDWVSIREFVIHNFGDALAYHRGAGNDSPYFKVHKVISDTLAAAADAIQDPTAPLVVAAHSLGAHMMSDYIWDRQHGRSLDVYTDVSNLVALVTFGCNIPLFSLDFDVATPIDLPGQGITKQSLIAASRWLNFLDRDDVLGWPLKPLYKADLPQLTARQRATIARIEDHEINVGGFATSWNPVAHNNYWTDDDFTKPFAEYLGALVRAV